MQEDIREQLSLTDEWFELGLVTQEKLSEFAQQWATGEDPNPEHYRWRAFTAFLHSNELLNEAVLRKLYRLAENDPDRGAGRAMQVDVLRRADCPLDVLESASNSEEKFLRKVAATELEKRAAR